jgi:hypothetical protein
MSKILTNSKKREIRKYLLKEFEYDNLKKARSGLGLSSKVKADTVYENLMELYNQQVKEIRKNKEKEKRKLRLQKQIKSFAIDYNYIDVIEEVDKIKGFVMLTALDKNNKVVKSIEIDTAEKVNSHHKQIYQKLFYDLKDLDDDNIPNRIIITEAKKVEPKKIIQAFKQGITNCVFTPIIKWAEDKRDTAKTKKTAKNYECRIYNLKEDEKKYRETGVNEIDLQEIANKHQIDIKIDLPFEQDFISVKSQSKPLTKFNFVNTRLNHVELNQITNNNIKIVDEDELRYIPEKLQLDYWEYSKNKSGDITCIKTIDTKYIIKNDYGDFINDFEKLTKINECYLDDFYDKDISEFVRQGCHTNHTIDFKDVNKVKDYQHIDQKNAYLNYRKCNYYNGFVGKITDFRATDKIEGVGLYRICNLKLTGKLHTLNKKMKIYNNYNVYPSPELQFIKDNGGNFNIIEGCWGVDTLYFNMDEKEWTNITGETKYYCKWVGSMMCYDKYKRFYIRCKDEDYIQNLVSHLECEQYTYKPTEDDTELRVNYKKDYNHHLCHIASFFTSYTRINTLEQLLEIEYDNIIRVCVDGIYYNGETTLKNIFRQKDEVIKKNDAGLTFISNYDIQSEPLLNPKRDHYLKELHKGAGGTGKTTKQLKDTGFIRPIYVAPSWKLARAKQNELGVKVTVWERLITSDPSVYNQIIKNNNTLIIDEISMLDDDLKYMIFNRFKMCKIVMCGDAGYQLSGFSVDEKKPYKEFTEDGFNNIISYTKNYRFTCSLLEQNMEKIRELIDLERNYGKKNLVKEYILNPKNGFNIIQEINNYKATDMILARTHKVKDVYSEQYKHINKYYITSTDRQYCKGEIIITDEQPKHGIIRHAFTVHSIQGETAEENLYIDIEGMNCSKAIHTAIGRARKMSQIYIINKN